MAARDNAGNPESLAEWQQTYRETNEGRIRRACDILHNMSLEYSRPWWRRLFGRWYISDEPLRNDAANFLREVGDKRMIPWDVRRVGEERRE